MPLARLLIHFDVMTSRLLPRIATVLLAACLGTAALAASRATEAPPPGDPGATLLELESILRGLAASERLVLPPAEGPKRRPEPPPRPKGQNPLARLSPDTTFHWIDLQAKLIDFKLAGQDPVFHLLSFKPVLGRRVKWQGEVVDCGERLFGGFECRLAMEPGYGEGVVFPVPDKAVAARLATLQPRDRISFTGIIARVQVVESPRIKVLVHLREVAVLP